MQWKEGMTAWPSAGSSTLIFVFLYSLSRTLPFILTIVILKGIRSCRYQNYYLRSLHDWWKPQKFPTYNSITIANRTIVELQPLVAVQVWGHSHPGSVFLVRPAGLWSRWVNHNNAGLVSDKPWCWIQWQPWSWTWSQRGNLGIHGWQKKVWLDISWDHFC